MLVSKWIEVDTAHRVPFHKGKCKGFHGHRYRIEVFVEDRMILTEGDPSEGMVIDYSDLKEVMMERIDKPLDHSSIYSKDDPMKGPLRVIEADSPKKFVWVDFIPTAENIAQYFYYDLEPFLRERGVKIHSVEVRETPSSRAIYKP